MTTIEAQGVEALTMRGLARDLGVSHAAPGRHFRTRAALLAALVAEAYGALTCAVLAAAKPDAPPAVRLNAMAAAAMTWAFDNGTAFSVMTNPDVSRFADDAVRANLRDFADAVKGAIGAAQQAGFHADKEADDLAAYLIGATLGVAMVLTDPLMATGLNIRRRPDAAALAHLIASA